MKTAEKVCLDGGYKAASVINLVVNKIVKPLTEKTFTKLSDGINYKEEEENALLKGVKKSLIFGLDLGSKCVIAPLNLIGSLAESSQTNLEEKLKKDHGIDVNYWMFSKENITIMDKVTSLINLITAELQDLSPLEIYRYVMAYAILQRVVRLFQKNLLFKKPDPSKPLEVDFEKGIELGKIGDHQGITVDADQDQKIYMQKVKLECQKYGKLAHACYGDLMNYVYSGKDLTKIITSADCDFQFLGHSGVDSKNLLFSDWESTPYKPAFCIVHDPEEKNIILALRGSLNWADFVTDLDFYYTNFSIIQDGEEQYIRENHRLNLEQAPLKNTRYYNSEEFQRIRQTKEAQQDLTKNEAESASAKEIFKGHAHTGIFLSGIELFKIIKPRLELIFKKLQSPDYKLVLTGHSLGGGMSIILTLLFLIHPLQYFRGANMREKIKSYTYGAPPVLSKEFSPFMEGILTNIVNTYDLVPRLSFGSIKDIIKVIKTLDSIQKNQKDFIDELKSFDIKAIQRGKKKLGPDDCLRLRAYMDLFVHLKTDEMKTIKLSPLGKTFVIEKNMAVKLPKNPDGKKEELFCELIEIKTNEYFNDLIFSKKLIYYHFPHLYEEYLNSKIEFKSLL